MKRWICVLLAALLPLAGRFQYRAAAALLPPPETALLRAEETAKEREAVFSVASELVRQYEAQRTAALAAARERMSDEELAASGSAALLYPAGLLCEAAAEGGEWLPAAFFGPEAGEKAVRLTADVLPALAAGGAWQSDGFSYALRFRGAVAAPEGYVAVTEPGEAFAFACPETCRVEYVLPAGAENGGNPAFLLGVPAAPVPLLEPALTGHVFDGWEADTGAYVDAIPAGTRELTLTAHFTPQTYRVNYVLTTRPGYVFIRISNDLNPKTYTYGETAKIASVDSPKGYRFSGWYETADFSGAPVTAIEAGRTGDVLLYARWLTEEEALAEEAAAARWGDLTDDGAVTAEDARLALRSAVGLENLPPQILARADFAQTGRLNAGVARTLLRVAVGLDTMPDVLRAYGRL